MVPLQIYAISLSRGQSHALGYESHVFKQIALNVHRKRQAVNAEGGNL